MNKINEWIKSGKAFIVDVRTPAEYAGGHVKGSKNIPLQELASRVDEIKAMQLLVLYCASGGRSGQAAQYLSSLGVECENGGSWLSVHALLIDK